MAAAAAPAARGPRPFPRQMWVEKMGTLTRTDCGCLVPTTIMPKRYTLSGILIPPRDIQYILAMNLTPPEFYARNITLSPCPFNAHCLDVHDHCKVVPLAGPPRVPVKRQLPPKTLDEVESWEPGDFVAARTYILARVAQDADELCWRWTMSTDKKSGTGNAVHYKGLRIAPQRLAYLAFRGEQEPQARHDGLRVGHTCSTHSCCNPEHLINTVRPDGSAISNHGYADTKAKHLQLKRQKQQQQQPEFEDALMMMIQASQMPHLQAERAAAAAAAAASGPS